MSRSSALKNFIKKYKHAWVFLYAFIYMPWFMYLEKHITAESEYHVIHSVLDDKIPFVEYFIVPYLLWFVFITAVFLYFFFTDVEGFYKLAKLSFYRNDDFSFDFYGVSERTDIKTGRISPG